MLLDGSIEQLNPVNMLLIGHTIEGDDKISHLRKYWFKFTIGMYAGDIEPTFQVQFLN